MVDVAEILTHWQAGRSSREISASLGVSRNTIAKYVAPAERAGIVRGGEPLSGAEWAVRIREWFPELTDTRVRQATAPVIEPHRAYIVEQRRQGVTMATIHQRLRDEHGLACSASSLRRWVAANLPEEEVRREQVAVLRPEPVKPGQEAQVDYGKLGRWTDPRTGQRHTVWAFAIVLCASRHLFVRPVIVMDQHAWTAAHVEAFEFFGGCPARIVPDNLKTGVDKPDLYDPKINKAYGELGAHYRVLIDPARSGKPKDKPQIERPMPYIRDSFWRGRGDTFTSLEHMQAEAVRWCGGGRAARMPAAGRGGAAGGVRGRRAAQAQAVAGAAVRAGDLVSGQGRPRVGSGLRQGPRSRRSVIPHHQRNPGRDRRRGAGRAG